MDSNHLRVYIAWGSLGFLTGVMVHAIRPLDSFSFWVPFLLIISALIIRHRIILIMLIACALGIWRFDMTLPTVRDDLFRQKGEIIQMIGRVKRVGEFNAVLDVQEVGDQTVRSSSFVSFSSRGRWIAVGEEWRVTCRLEENEKPEMRYRLWDARKGIFLRCRGSTKISRIHEARPWDVTAILARWRKEMSGRIDQLFPGDEGALLAGILYGERGLSEAADEAFRFAGMTHLIAVSGSNITLVVSLFVPILLFIGYRRQSAIVLSGAGILLFTIFVGAEASVVRAAIMGWLAVLARAFGRKPHVSHLLLVAGMVMVLFDPWSLAFDAGFALSFLATWGLIAWTKPITALCRWVPKAFGLREIVATTFAATFVTTPYLFWAFERVSLAGLITNLFAIPLVGFAMAWGALAFVAGTVIPVAVYPALGCLRAMLLIAETATSFPFLQIAFQLPTWGLFVSYGVMILIWRLNKAKNQGYSQEDSFKTTTGTVLRAFVRPIVES